VKLCGGKQAQTLTSKLYTVRTNAVLAVAITFDLALNNLFDKLRQFLF
jgi:hypothetical protein